MCSYEHIATPEKKEKGSVHFSSENSIKSAPGMWLKSDAGPYSGLATSRTPGDQCYAPAPRSTGPVPPAITAAVEVEAWEEAVRTRVLWFTPEEELS
jgi:hypothetical protein